MTYRELYNLFINRNKDIARLINDYRPYGEAYTIQLWFKNGQTCYVKWVSEIDEFVFGEIKEWIE